KPGLFEAAHRGSLFLDEIGDLPATAQVRLLRALEGGELRRLGDTTITQVDVRVIAATNRSLRAEMIQGRFRSDLFYRLRGMYCRIPPLRDRSDDIEALIDFWLPGLARRLNSPVRAVTAGALATLRTYAWPGNVRELRNVLSHAVSLASGSVITDTDFASILPSAALCEKTTCTALAHRCADERRLFIDTLNLHHWKIARAAASLGVSRSTLWRRLRRHHIRSCNS